MKSLIKIIGAEYGRIEESANEIIHLITSKVAEPVNSNVIVHD